MLPYIHMSGEAYQRALRDERNHKGKSGYAHLRVRWVKPKPRSQQ